MEKRSELALIPVSGLPSRTQELEGLDVGMTTNQREKNREIEIKVIKSK